MNPAAIDPGTLSGLWLLCLVLVVFIGPLVLLAAIREHVLPRFKRGPFRHLAMIERAREQARSGRES